MTDFTLAICVYNAEKYIKETLESVMAQTMQDFHLLIVNDCSTDNSVAIIEQFFTEHPRQVEILHSLCHNALKCLLYVFLGVINANGKGKIGHKYDIMLRISVLLCFFLMLQLFLKKVMSG